jgi:type II secretory pathway pseudopilin PulG
MNDPHAHTPPNRLKLAIVPLHIGAVIYVVLALGVLAVVALVMLPDTTDPQERMISLLVFGLVALMCLGIAALSEVVVWGLGRRRMWAWIAGLCIFAMYVPSLFFPLGALGLWGLLDPGSRALFGMGPAAAPATSGAPAGATVRAGWSPGCIVGVVCAVGLAVFALPMLGIVAAIAIPNFLDATGKAKQMRTLGDLRAISVAVEASRAQTGALPAEAPIESVLEGLRGFASSELVATDAWGHPFRYRCWSAFEDPGCTTYALLSAGRDGFFEHEDARAYFEPPPPGVPGVFDFDADLVLIDGAEVRDGRPRP